jgi:hypothetical protein
VRRGEAAAAAHRLRLFDAAPVAQSRRGRAVGVAP